MIAAQQRHHFFGLGGVGEGREAAQIEKHDGDLATVRAQWIVFVARDDQFGQMRREKPLELRQALQLAQLLLHALFETGVERGELLTLCCTVS